MRSETSGREDFQLFDKGKAQTITNKFTIQRSDSPGAAGDLLRRRGKARRKPPRSPVLPDRYVAYLFDDIHLKTGDLLLARQAVNRHLDESLERSSSRAALFSPTSGQDVSSTSTDDREKLHSVINSILPWTGGPTSQDCPTMSYYAADYLVNRTAFLEGFLNSDKQVEAAAVEDQIFQAVLKEAQVCLGPPPPGVNQADWIALGVLKLRMAAHQEPGVPRSGDGLRAGGGAGGHTPDFRCMPGSRSMVLVSKPGFLLTRSGNHRS